MILHGIWFSHTVASDPGMMISRVVNLRCLSFGLGKQDKLERLERDKRAAISNTGEA